MLMSTRFDTHCQYLYDLAFQRRRKEFKKAIETASEEQILAIIEVLVNREQFLQDSIPFNVPKLIKSPRKVLIKNWIKVLLILANAFNEVTHCETCLLLLEEE